MNVSMQDAFNLGWKLSAVLEGRSPAGLLRTYSAERRAVAEELIAFDREWSTAMARPSEGSGRLQDAFVRAGRYTAGVATRYEPSSLVGLATHQGLATGFPIGMRFHSAPVVRIADGKDMQLGHTHEADGRWRIYVFSDATGTLAATLFAHIQKVRARFTPVGADPDAVLDVRGIYPDREIRELPEALRPHKGALSLRDYEKAFAARTHGGTDIYDLRGIDRARGALVVVRPDQYVSHVLPLDAYDELDAFFGGILQEVA